MKQLLVAALIAAGVVGCGASVEDDGLGLEPGMEVIDVGPLEDGSELPREAWPVLLREVEVEGQNVKFVKVFVQYPEANLGPDHVIPNIIMITTTPEGSPNVIAELRNSVKDVVITPAEIYMGLVNSRDELPSDLAIDHFQQAAMMNRPGDFLEAYRLPLSPEQLVELDAGLQEKAIHATLGTTSDPVLSPPIPGHHYENNHANLTQMKCTDQPNLSCAQVNVTPSWYACTNRTSFSDIRGWNIPNQSQHCDEFRTKGWIRTGVRVSHSDFSTTPFTVQGWFGPSSGGAWLAYPPASLAPGTAQTWDWSSTASKVMTLAVTRPFSSSAWLLDVTTKVVPN